MPIVGQKRCRLHGGRTPVGIASPHFKHGRFSKYLPTQLARRFKDAANDPALLSLDRDVALIDSRLIEVLQTLGRPGGSWDAVHAAHEMLVGALTAGDKEAGAAALKNLRQSISAGMAERAVWGEVLELLDQRRRTIDSIRKHEVESAEMVTLTEAQVLFSGMAHLVREHVKDKQALRAIAAGFARLTQGPVALLPAHSGGI